MKHSTNDRKNVGIVLGILAIHAFILGGLPLLLPYSLWWGVALIPMVWLNVVHWGLIHEAIHKLLFSRTSVNELAGRLLGILMGASFHALRFGHLMHHQLNRQFHSEQVAERTVSTRLGYYFHLLAGLYITEAATSLLLLMPQRQFTEFARATFLKPYPDAVIAGERFFYKRGTIHRLRVDMLLMISLYSAAFYHFGVYWPVLLAFFMIRAAVISWMDNIYHFDTPTDNSKAAKELALPAFLSACILHGNYHETHHVNPDVPWHALPSIQQAQARRFDGRFIDHGLLQFSGPGLKV